MSSASYVLEIEPEVIINEGEPFSISTFSSSPSPSLRESNTPPCFNDILSKRDRYFFDVERFSTESECETLLSNSFRPTVEHENEIKIDGSVIIVPPAFKGDLPQKKSSNDIEVESKAYQPVICNEIHQKHFYNSTMKMKNSVLCSKRYNPLLFSETADPKNSIRRSFQQRNFQSVEEHSRLSIANEDGMQTKRPLQSVKKTSQRFVCNFCDRLFKSLDDLQSHHEIHGINYWRKPYSWMEEDILLHSGDRNEILCSKTSENEEDSYEDEGFTCQVCDMIFATARGLTKHMDVHRIPYTKNRTEVSQESVSEEGHAMIDLTD